MIRHRNFLGLGAVTALAAAASLSEVTGDFPTDFRSGDHNFKRRSKPYVPPPASQDVIDERLRLAADKRARKAERQARGFAK